MASGRIRLAQEAGWLTPADGPVVWFGGSVEDVTDTMTDVVFVQDDAVASAALKSRSLSVQVETPASASIAVVSVPRSKQLARIRVAEAMAIATGMVVVDGRKTDGIEGLLREIRSRAPIVDVISKDHGKIVRLKPTDAFEDWRNTGPARVSGGYWTQAGVFSSDGPDPGSVALAEVLPGDLAGRIADLGAGWGYLSAHILKAPSPTEVHLVEASHRALDCAKRNVQDPRARFHWADVTRFEDAAGFDVVVTNPPFHLGRRGDPSLGVAFIQAARGLLKPSGVLWLVANRHLPYERALSSAFGEVKDVGPDGAFKVFRARRPARKGKAHA